MAEEDKLVETNDMELGYLDVTTLTTTITTGETKNIPHQQWDLLADLYNSMDKDKPATKHETPAMSDSNQSHLGTKAQKKRDMPKIQSNTLKKGRKYTKQLIQELGTGNLPNRLREEIPLRKVLPI